MSKCIFSRIQEQFDHDDMAALNSLLSNQGHLAVAREMTSAGFPMSEHTVRRHKKHDCMCSQVAA